LSDVYAMGGEPLTALGIVAFPVDSLPLEVLTRIMRGGQDKVHEAGAVVIGGHSIIDQELKYGLSVTGRVHPGRILTNNAARPGDQLVLTKSLGTGFVTTALKSGKLPTEDGRVAIEAMRALNRDAAAAAIALGIRCATDVTGFGLLGHASHVARASEVTIRIHAGRVPALDGAERSWRAGATPGGAERNAAYLEPLVGWGTVEPFVRALVVDPQTSGGLLLSVPASVSAEYLSRVPGAVVIGDVSERGVHLLEVG
jgi:selenide,water dikinase